MLFPRGWPTVVRVLPGKLAHVMIHLDFLLNIDEFWTVVEYPWTWSINHSGLKE